MKNSILEKISKRESEILDLVSHGFSSTDIATQLYISTHTVITHRKNLTIKLKAKNVAHLIRIAYENKLIQSANENIEAIYVATQIQIPKLENKRYSLKAI